MAGGGQPVSGMTGDDKRWQGVIYFTLASLARQC